MKLHITIPALNEEESIRSIIEKTLEARSTIIAESPVDEVEVTVVSDGSTDHTVEYAQEYTDRIKLIIFPENKGYGAAITEGWRQSDADLLSFLDADGTCDPKFFAKLCTALENEKADIALGCRLHKNSHMPLIRRVGNMGFAAILSVLSMRRVRDSASGMRVVRRECLDTLFPLPASLNFTPAMSARALLSGQFGITEIDMPYAEREGESKLHPLRDGWRFLKVILKTAFIHRPGRPLGLLAVLLFLISGVMMISPTIEYTQTSEVQQPMIYRFLVAGLLAVTGVSLLCASHLARKAADISLSLKPTEDRYSSTVSKLFRGPLLWFVAGVLAIVGLGLVWEDGMDYVRTGSMGEVYDRWPRFVIMMFMLSVSVSLVATKFLDLCLNLLAERLQYLREK